MWSRPLRSDELMHSHKYIDKVRTKGGAWRYIYDLAGGSYKKAADKHREQARRAAISDRYYFHKGEQHEKAAEINRNSANAFRKAAANPSTSEKQKKILKEKSKEHSSKSINSSIEANNAYRRSNDAYVKSQHEGREARKNENEYKKTLAYKYDTSKNFMGSTLKKAKKRVDKGKDFLSNLFKPKITVSHDVRIK